jgi:hypothetical protein
MASSPVPTVASAHHKTTDDVSINSDDDSDADCDKIFGGWPIVSTTNHTSKINSAPPRVSDVSTERPNDDTEYDGQEEEEDETVDEGELYHIIFIMYKSINFFSMLSFIFCSVVWDVRTRSSWPFG